MSKTPETLSAAKLYDQIGNLLVLEALFIDLPDAKIVPGLWDWSNADMSWEGPNHCGAAACVGGWVAITPQFQRQGVRNTMLGMPVMDSPAGRLMGNAVAVELFGYKSLFDPNSTLASDRDVVTQRIRDALENCIHQLEKLG